jgi:hypothetical protein
MEALDERMRQQQQSGQNGQQPSGQNGNQGQPGNARQGAGGSGNAPGSLRDGPPGPWSREDIRQYTNEFHQRRRDAEALRDELRRQRETSGDLNQLIDRMQQLENSKLYDDPTSLAVLRQSVLEGTKQFEYGLRRKIEGGNKEQLFLSGSDEVPPGYRELVEEYYRLLSRTPK